MPPVSLSLPNPPANYIVEQTWGTNYMVDQSYDELRLPARICGLSGSRGGAADAAAAQLVS